MPDSLMANFPKKTEFVLHCSANKEARLFQFINVLGVKRMNRAFWEGAYNKISILLLASAMILLFLFGLAVFEVSFRCSGKKAGGVDMTFKLNYTGVASGLVDTDDMKTFMVVVRRECLKTGILVGYIFGCLQLITGKKYLRTSYIIVRGQEGNRSFLVYKTLLVLLATSLEQAGKWSGQISLVREILNFQKIQW